MPTRQPGSGSAPAAEMVGNLAHGS
jgi:hypothetical protein